MWCHMTKWTPNNGATILLTSTFHVNTGPLGVKSKQNDYICVVDHYCKEMSSEHVDA